MRRVFITLALVLLGAGMLVYPFISNYFAEQNSSKAIQGYAEKLEEYDEATRTALWEEAEVYNQNLTGHPVHDPFIEGTGMAMPEDYKKVLSVEEIMGFIEIPKIKVNLPIYHGTSDTVLEKGIGHLEGSTLPIGGISRHSVLTGHTGLTNAKMFTDLIEIEVGDLFYIHILDETLAYRVDSIKVIEPNITDDLRRAAGKDYCTLLTCTPYGVNSHRLLVRGERVEYNPVIAEAIVPLASSYEYTLVVEAAIITSSIMGVLVIATFIFMRRRRKREEAGFEVPPILSRRRAPVTGFPVASPAAAAATASASAVSAVSAAVPAVASAKASGAAARPAAASVAAASSAVASVAAASPAAARIPVVEAVKPAAAKKQEAFMKVRLSRKKALFVIVPNYGTSTQTA